MTDASPCHCPFVGCQAPWHKISLSANHSCRAEDQAGASFTHEEKDIELANCYHQLRERENEINQLRAKVYKLEQLLVTQCRRFEAMAVDSLMSLHQIARQDSPAEQRR